MSKEFKDLKINKKLAESFKTLENVVNNESISGYFLITTTRDSKNNRAFYYTFNCDNEFELLGTVISITDILKEKSKDVLSDDAPAFVPDVNAIVNSKLQ